MTHSYWHQPASSAPRSPLACDVAIVGGGIVGTATAYWLTQQTNRRVVLLEAEMLAHGASGRNAGFILQGTAACYQAAIERYGHDRARRIWHITQTNRDLLATELDGAAFGWRPCGSWILAGDAAEDTALRTSHARMRDDGWPGSYVSAEDLNARLGTTGFRGGLYVPGGGTVDPVRLVHHLAARSRAVIYPNHPVRALTDTGDAIRLVTPHRTVEAQQVVLAMGPSVSTLVADWDAYVRPVRAQMLATAPLDRRVLAAPIYSHHGAFYVRQQPSGVVLAGGGRHTNAALEETDRDAVTDAVQSSIAAYLQKHIPWSASAPVHQRWSGTMGFSPDGLPVVGRVTACPRVLAATGCTGHGMGFGMWTGRTLATWAATGQPPVEADVVAVSRFGTSS